MNVLAQNVGIWYKDKEWKDKIFKEIRENIPDEAVLRCVNGIYDNEIRLKDGSVIKMIPATKVARGNAIAKAYIQHGIDFEIYQTIIAPCIKPYFFNAIVVNKLDDFLYGGRIADKDYWINIWGRERDE